MTVVPTTRNVDVGALSFDATARWFGDHGEVEADVDETTLRAAVDAAPTVLNLVTQEANRRTIEDAARSHLTDLRQLARSTGALTNTQRDNALRVIAKALILVIRLLLRQLDATD